MPASATRRWLIGGTLFAALIAAVSVFLVIQPGPERPPNGVPDVLTPDEARRNRALRNTAVALLENARYREAVAAFDELVEALPAEPLGTQNRLISRLLAAELEGDAARRQALLTDADADVNRLRQLAPDSAATERLAARLAELRQDDAAAFDAQARAADLAPDDAGFHFELYLLGERLEHDAERRPRARAALDRAYELEPDNLVVLFNQLTEQTRAEEAAIRATLAGARKTLRPFADRYLQYNRELDAAIDEALDAVDQGNWRAAFTALRALQNLTLIEVAWGIDDRRIKRHLLEYVAHEFSEGFHEQTGLAPQRRSDPIPVRFAQAPAEAQPPPLADTLAVRLVDFDLDGTLDIVALWEDRVEVYARPRDAAGWQLIASAELDRPMHGIVAVDLDRDVDENPDVQPFDVISRTQYARCIDADVDLVLYGPGGILLFRNVLVPRPEPANEGQLENEETARRSLERVPQDEAFEALRDVFAVEAADLDHDGDLDLIVSSAAGLSLWSNRDDFTFENISRRSGLPPTSLAATTILPVDWDRTVTIDAILGGAAAGVLENLLHGRFRWREFRNGFDRFAGARSLAVVDADSNGSWDLVAGGTHGIVLASTRTPLPGVVRLERITEIDPRPVLGLVTCDYDNDGYLDIVAWTSDRIDIYRGGPDGRFERQDGLVQQPPGPIQSVHAGDLDHDGGTDLLVQTPERLVWLSNAGGNAHNWIDLAIRSDPDRSPQRRSERANVHGLGSLLELKAGELYQPRVVREQFTRFGLGRLEGADVVRVLWTNGIPHNVLAPERNQTICEQQELMGSCPYLYTWTGSRYEFLTDCLWSAPLGLQLAEGVVAPMREWEYLKIPGERLVPVDGEYRLQITEELWEAGYFDLVRLVAIDHPADVDVYTNEKVGPAEIAEFKVHTVRDPRRPVAARDQRGRDVLGRLHEPGVFVRPFEQWFKQGLTEEHFLELDLGPLDDPRQITLFLTGWIFPTDSSLNVAISQNPELDAPRPPALWVPDANGQWQNVIPYMGFPGGKTKTIAVDLSNVFLTDDYRVRIVTSMEICWDNAFFTVDEAPADFVLTGIDAAAADLHYRGFSRVVKTGPDAPDWYDYDDVSTEPRWPPMMGRFTRYGDVTELIQAADDRLVVLAPGDELTVRFKVPDAGPPPGWKRDFFLHNIGWDKDANLNTITGQTVEPLPFRAMKQYPPGLDDTPPDSPEYHEYLRKYQTREQHAGRFWRGMRTQ